MRSDFPARPFHQTIFSDFCIRQSVQIGTVWRESLNRLSNTEVWKKLSGEPAKRESLGVHGLTQKSEKCLVEQFGRNIWKHCLTQKFEKIVWRSPANNFFKLCVKLCFHIFWPDYTARRFVQTFALDYALRLSRNTVSPDDFVGLLCWTIGSMS